MCPRCNVINVLDRNIKTFLIDALESEKERVINILFEEACKRAAEAMHTRIVGGTVELDKKPVGFLSTMSNDVT